MGRIIIRIIIVLSLSLNVALGYILMTSPSANDGVKLNLSKAQVNEVNQIHLAMHKKNEQIKAEIRKWQEKLIDALKVKEIDDAQVNICLENISTLQKQIQRNTIQEIIQTKKGLTDHQCDHLINSLGTKLSQASKPCDKACCNPQKNQ